MVLAIGVVAENVARAAAALPAAGAWDAAPTELFCAGAEYVTLYITYTRGGAGGSVRLRLEASPHSVDRAVVEDWFLPTIKQVGAFAAGADVNSGEQRENGVLYTATAAAAEMFAYGPVHIQAAERIRVRAQEVGAAGTPGTLHIIAMLGATP